MVCLSCSSKYKSKKLKINLLNNDQNLYIFRLTRDEKIEYTEIFFSVAKEDKVFKNDFPYLLGMLGTDIAQSFALRLFETFSTNNEYIELEQYLKYIDVYLHGDIDERCLVTFQLINSSKTGKVTFQEFKDYLELIISAINKVHPLAQENFMSKNEIKSLFSNIAKNNSFFTLEQFKYIFLNKPELISWLDYFKNNDDDITLMINYNIKHMIKILIKLFKNLGEISKIDNNILMFDLLFKNINKFMSYIEKLRKKYINTHSNLNIRDIFENLKVSNKELEKKKSLHNKFNKEKNDVNIIKRTMTHNNTRTFSKEINNKKYRKYSDDNYIAKKHIINEFSNNIPNKLSNINNHFKNLKNNIKKKHNKMDIINEKDSEINLSNFNYCPEILLSNSQKYESNLNKYNKLNNILIKKSDYLCKSTTKDICSLIDKSYEDNIDIDKNFININNTTCNKENSLSNTLNNVDNTFCKFNSINKNNYYNINKLNNETKDVFKYKKHLNRNTMLNKNIKSIGNNINNKNNENYCSDSNIYSSSSSPTNSEKTVKLTNMNSILYNISNINYFKEMNSNLKHKLNYNMDNINNDIINRNNVDNLCHYKKFNTLSSKPKYIRYNSYSNIKTDKNIKINNLIKLPTSKCIDNIIQYKEHYKKNKVNIVCKNCKITCINNNSNQNLYQYNDIDVSNVSNKQKHILKNNSNKNKNTINYRSYIDDINDNIPKKNDLNSNSNFKINDYFKDNIMLNNLIIYIKEFKTKLFVLSETSSQLIKWTLTSYKWIETKKLKPSIILHNSNKKYYKHNTYNKLNSSITYSSKKNLNNKICYNKNLTTKEDYSNLEVYNNNNNNINKFKSNNTNLKSKFKSTDISNKKSKGNKLKTTDINFKLLIKIIMGIQLTVLNSSNIDLLNKYIKLSDEILIDYLKSNSYTIESNGSRKKENYYISEFAPVIFNSIRKIYNISKHEYVLSISPQEFITELMVSSTAIIEELFSTGKSGSMFYYTKDGKFIIKTISKNEYYFLRKIIKDYFLHLINNKSTFLPKFYGCYKLIKKIEKKKQRIYFVTMDNIFSTSNEIHLRYDLKGSRIGRKVLNVQELSTNEKYQYALKELDFENYSNFMYLGKTKKEHFIKQLELDTQFLQSKNIIDYSMLVGIHSESVFSKDKEPQIIKNYKLQEKKASLKTDNEKESNLKKCKSTLLNNSNNLINNFVLHKLNTINTSVKDNKCYLNNQHSLNGSNKNKLYRDNSDNIVNNVNSLDCSIKNKNSNNINDLINKNFISYSNTNISDNSFDSFDKISSCNFKVFDENKSDNSFNIRNLEDGGILSTSEPLIKHKTDINTYKCNIDKIYSIVINEGKGEILDDYTKDIYYIGIIDILTEFNSGKICEYLSKSIVYMSQSMSCIPPTKYRNRFLKYLNDKIK